MIDLPNEGIIQKTKSSNMHQVLNQVLSYVEPILDELVPQ